MPFCMLGSAGMCILIKTYTSACCARATHDAYNIEDLHDLCATFVVSMRDCVSYPKHAPVLINYTAC